MKLTADHYRRIGQIVVNNFDQELVDALIIHAEKLKNIRVSEPEIRLLHTICESKDDKHNLLFIACAVKIYSPDSIISNTSTKDGLGSLLSKILGVHNTAVSKLISSARVNYIYVKTFKNDVNNICEIFDTVKKYGKQSDELKENKSDKE